MMQSKFNIQLNLFLLHAVLTFEMNNEERWVIVYNQFKLTMHYLFLILFYYLWIFTYDHYFSASEISFTCAILKNNRVLSCMKD